MNSAFDRFLSGTDKLTEVLRELPPYVAPLSLAEAVAADSLAREEELRAADPASQAFVPPASLEAAVMREAQAMEQAQAPRRDALRAALVADADATDALGAPVSAATQAWLRDTWLPTPEPGIESSRPTAPRRSGWRFRLAFGLCCGIATLTGLTVWQWIAPTLEETSVVATALPENRPMDWTTLPLEKPKLEAKLATAPPVESAPPIVAEMAPPVAPTRKAVEKRPTARPESRLALAQAEPRPEPLPEIVMQAPPTQVEDDMAVERFALAAPPDVSAQRETSLPTAAPLPYLPAHPETIQPQAAAPAPAASRARAAVFSGPLDDAQWQRLAALLPEARARYETKPAAEDNGIVPHHPIWRLLTSAPDAPAARTLADTLSNALAPGAILIVVTDPSIPAGQARLVAP